MIRALRREFGGLSVHRMCALLGVSRALVYARSRPKEPGLPLEAVEHLASRYLGYGYRRMTRALRCQGIATSEYAVRHFLREHGLLARRPRSRGLTRASSRDRRAGNLAKGMHPEGPNRLWGADTTRIRTESGPLYLAAMVDLYSRKVVGWKLSRRNDEALVAACLQAALEHRRPPLGWIHHSDQGSTYTAAGYTGRVRAAGGRLSLSAPGKPRDNAHVESFFRTLKLEEVDRNRYEDFRQAQQSIDQYIHDNYNATRMHSALEYMSPDQFESLYRGTQR
jgi:transposase InsO family protein